MNNILTYFAGEKLQCSIGIVLGGIVQGVLLYGFDHFAQARGKIYYEFLNAL